MLVIIEKEVVVPVEAEGVRLQGWVLRWKIATCTNNVLVHAQTSLSLPTLESWQFFHFPQACSTRVIPSCFAKLNQTPLEPLFPARACRDPRTAQRL
jgi:hypothetical protein